MRTAIGAFNGVLYPTPSMIETSFGVYNPSGKVNNLFEASKLTFNNQGRS